MPDIMSAQQAKVLLMVTHIVPGLALCPLRAPTQSGTHATSSCCASLPAVPRGCFGCAPSFAHPTLLSLSQHSRPKCNFTFSSSHIGKLKKKEVTLTLIIYFIPSNISIYHFDMYRHTLEILRVRFQTTAIK